ncbi:MAG: UDP-glucose 4-epimerase GalE [Deltaproteobacteria bacterium]|nr:UDP-glucose 4-epimerase GalE [Deltaproteobacteria bacterium]
MLILVTGGAGYIGSHTCVELLLAGHDVVVVDDFSNSSPEALRRVERLAGRPVHLHQLDILDAARLETVFAGRSFDAVIHFAGLKAVGESVAQPLRYFRTNLGTTLNLLEAMARHGVQRLVFSSSSTVYGNPTRVPLTEDMPLSAVNPYGRTKLMIEDILRDFCAANADWQVALLRYFNPVGAHASGLMGEDPRGIPNNLMPFITKVAVGRLEALSVFGTDYPTPDGTAIRDYIHVVDVARGHVAAVQGLASLRGARAVNLGTGRGHSVREVISAMERVLGRPLPTRNAPRRAGDATASWADPSLARQLWGWTATHTLDDMCRDALRWQTAHPDGYDTRPA